jgi:serine/threonine protein kinase
MSQVRLRLLGGASLIGPDGPIAGRGAQRRRLAILALLAVTRKPISRERLMAYLWPDAEPDRARKLLSESLYVLRKDVHEDAFPVSGDEVRLDTRHIACDVAEFEDAVARHDHAGAVELYGGPFLDGFFIEDADEFERWAASQRDRLERVHRTALETLAAGTSDSRAAVQWWRRLADVDPYDGRVAIGLMTALSSAGDRAEALQHARVHEQRMRDDLGATADPAVLEMADRLRAGDGATHADAAPSPSHTREATHRSPRSALEQALAGEYRIERILGTGATSQAFLARDIALDMPVTIKVLKAELASAPEARIRFEREARAAANVVHPNVSNVHRFGTLPDGTPYLVIEYVRGRTVEQQLAAEGAFAVGDTRRIVADVAGALDAAHRHGVVHRDIRPDNILLDDADGKAIVTDFGLIAVTEAWQHGLTNRVTRTGQIIGDLRYASPEQSKGEPVSDASDVYSLAIVAHQMLTGSLPFEELGAREAATARASGAAIVLPPHIRDADPQLADLLGRCLAEDPRRRPSASAIAKRLSATAAASATDSGIGLLPIWMRRGWHALSRRRLPQWVAAAFATGWLLLQIIGEVIDQGRLARVAWDVTAVSVAAATVIAAILAWFHGESGEQRFRGIELALLGATCIAWIAALLALLR